MEDLKTALHKRCLAVASLPEKGRCLLATRDFRPGEVIISQDPYVFVPNSAEPRCDRCFASTDLRRCSACQAVWYCGSSCQKSEWKVHRLECMALVRLDKEKRKSVTPSIRLMIKLYIRRKLQDEKIISTTAMDIYSLVDALVAHMSEIDEKQLVLYAQMANLVNRILQWPEINMREVAENFSKLSCNAHTICDSELRPLGTGLYPVISIINHSCLPNAVLLFEGRMAVVRAVQQIVQGSEVLISYIETAGSTTTRLKSLREQYHFACACPRCAKLGQPDDIKESAILEGYRCEDDRCSGLLLCDSEKQGFVCQLCGRVRNKEEIRGIASEIKLMSERTSSSMSPSQAVSVYKMIENLQGKLYHPFSIILLQTREKILKMLMDLQGWKEALVYCKLTIPVYERVYPGCHPLLGLQYYTSGKLEWLLGDTINAIKSLTKAVDILRVTHGTNAEFVRDLMMKLEEARAEASHNLSCADE
ncbi:histone-lysine N-methyltransferase ASHR1 [Syzygium oleosum]|uniref:histone-lysine N-methyltransferase ASHR1 n=1 Tax=Syzygium oleosum TaxID=219896 RepID=UPI0024B95F61|nr:histone-lysine N-methyltransferase ASHR1 [Syzygium oleosum]